MQCDVNDITFYDLDRVLFSALVVFEVFVDLILVDLVELWFAIIENPLPICFLFCR
jgi:hypothetical protein